MLAHSTKQTGRQRGRASRTSALFILLAALTLLRAAPAYAHARLVRSDPADGAALSQAPASVHVEFSEPVSLSFSTFKLLDLDGRPIKPKSIRFDDGQQRVTLELPPLADGVYSLVWKIISDRDGHSTRGHIVFTVGQANGAPRANADDSASAASPLEAALRALNLTALAGLLGCAAMRLTVLRNQAGTPYRRRVRLFAAACGVLAAAAAVGLFWHQLNLVRDETPDGAAMVAPLLQSRWGVVWLARSAATAALLFALSAKPGARDSTAITMAAACALVISMAQAASGHLSDTIPTLMVDAVHLLAASAWIGGLAVLSVTSWPELRDPARLEVCLQTIWRPFTGVAIVAVGALIASGLASSANVVSSIDAIVATAYGRALLLKTGLLLAAGALGVVHSRSIVRRGKLSRRTLPVEIGLGSLALLVAGWLTASPPANGPEFAPPKSTVSSISQPADDLLITLAVKPNVPGANVFSVIAASSRRPAPAEIARVMLKMTGPNPDQGASQGVAEQVETDANSFRLGGTYLNAPGIWHIDVTVRRKGLQDSVSSFEWTVPDPAAGSRPVVISNQPVAGVLMALAGFALAAALGLAGLRWARMSGRPARLLADRGAPQAP